MATINKINGTYQLLGPGGKIPLHILSGKDLFNAEEIAADIIAGKLILAHHTEETSAEDRHRDAISETMLSLVAWREDLLKYLEIKTFEKYQDKYIKILEECSNLNKRLELQSDTIMTLTREISQLRSMISQPSRVNLKEVAKIFPQFSISTLRNELSRNRRYDPADRKWHSYIKRDEFYLEFSRARGQKQWWSERFDYVAQKGKTFDYDFRKRMEKRTNHAKGEK